MLLLRDTASLPFPSSGGRLPGLVGLDAAIVESGEQCAVTGVLRLVHMLTDNKRA